MKFKFENWDYWQRIVAPNSQFSYSTVSPVNCIGGPHIAYAWAGLGTATSGVVVPVGTIVGCRIDNKDPLPINLDYWRLNLIGSLPLLEIRDITNKAEIPEHWTCGVPSVFQWAPSSIKEVIIEEQERNSDH